MILTSSSSNFKSNEAKWNFLKTPVDWSNTRNNRIKQHIAETKRLRNDKQNLNRNLNLSDINYDSSEEDNKDDIIDDLIFDYSDKKKGSNEIKRKIEEFDNRQLISKALKFDNSINTDVDKIK